MYFFDDVIYNSSHILFDLSMFSILIGLQYVKIDIQLMLSMQIITKKIITFLRIFRPPIKTLFPSYGIFGKIPICSISITSIISYMVNTNCIKFLLSPILIVCSGHCISSHTCFFLLPFMPLNECINSCANAI